jgi:hypothetical protein
VGVTISSWPEMGGEVLFYLEEVKKGHENAKNSN